MTLINVNLSLAFKTELKLSKTPGVLTSLHSFTDNAVLSTEKCATSKIIPKNHPNDPTKKDPNQFMILPEKQSQHIININFSLWQPS